MSEFKKVCTKKELHMLDDDDVLAGYLAGLNGEREPGSDRSRSFWHGWRNGMVDSGRSEKDEEQAMLAEEVVRSKAAL